MRILLIGNFAPPYEDENLHNISLLRRLKEEGNDCRVINISENPSREKGFIDAKGFVDFVFKLIRHGWRRDVIHFLTKGYTRPGLMKLMTTAIIGRLFLAKIIFTFHSELFSIFGQLRSKMGGQQLLHLSFSLADKVICCDKHTYEVASIYHKSGDLFEVIPSFIYLPEELSEGERLSLKKLENREKIIVFSNVRYPSLLFEILNHMLSSHLDQKIGIAISFSEKFSSKLQHAIEDSARDLSDSMIFIDHTDERLLSMVYARADLILRTLSCDGKRLFDDIALCAKRSVHSDNYVHFPLALYLVKEGDVSELCAYLFNNILMEKTEALPAQAMDFYTRIKEIYT